MTESLKSTDITRHVISALVVFCRFFAFKHMIGWIEVR